jgi:hypothetical protein
MDSALQDRVGDIVGGPEHTRVESCPWNADIDRVHRASATATSSSDCEGTRYSIRAGDTCHSIALSQGYSTTQLIAANDMTAYCRGFPTAGTICLPSSLKCKPLVPKSGDTCNSIAADNGISFAQLVSWNPELGQFCGNMGTLISKSMAVCVSNPGGSWADPSPVKTSSTPTTRAEYVVSLSHLHS